MDCPHCDADMDCLLINDHASIYWCPECGTVHDSNDQVWVPTVSQKPRKPR